MPLAQGYLPILLLALFLTGCTESHQVQTFEARPMEKRLHWNLPAGWSLRYDGDGIRWGSFAGPGGAVISITRFPGGVGDELMNINRWRTQLGLSEVSSAHMDDFSGKLPWRWTWLENNNEILAGAMTQIAGTTLTFKLTAKDSNTSALRRDFLKILEGISWE